MKITREARRVARELFQLSLVDGCLDRARIEEISRRVVTTKPRNYLQILKEFTRLVRLELDKRHAVVDSAVALDEPFREQLQQTLLAKFGSDITMEFRVNPTLLGGLRIKLGSDVWDGSVLGRLNALSKQL